MLLQLELILHVWFPVRTGVGRLSYAQRKPLGKNANW